MVIGELTPTNQDTSVDGQFTGYLKTLAIDLWIRTIPNRDKPSDRAPDLLVQAVLSKRQCVEVGRAWWKPFKREDGTST